MLADHEVIDHSIEAHYLPAEDVKNSYDLLEMWSFGLIHIHSRSDRNQLNKNIRHILIKVI